MAQGKLDADLGRHDAAAAAFAAVAGRHDIADAVRWEALVRLGVERRATGDHRGSVKVFQEVWKNYGRDKEAVRFLVLAVGGALPGEDRWNAIWQRVALESDDSEPARPQLAVRWPEGRRSRPRHSGAPISIDFKDADILEIFRLIADVTQLNVVVFPGVHGRITYKAEGAPWDEVLDKILTLNGLTYRIEGNMLWVAEAADLGGLEKYTGKHMDVDFHEADLHEVFGVFEGASGLKIVSDPEVAGHITLLLKDVPWDQAFAAILRVNGLTQTREGQTIHVRLPRRQR